MDAFAVVADPVRRRVLELLAEAELTAGAVCTTVQGEYAISQPAVSQHLKVLRDAGLVSVRVDGPRRLYTVQPGPLHDIDDWLERFRGGWTQRLDALATEVARGKRRRRRSETDTRRSAS